MKSGLELIYSRQDSDFIKGRAYANPRFFTSPRAGVSKVYLVGDWPKIRAVYEALGVPVEQLDAAQASAPVQGPRGLKVAENPGAAVIPEDWRDLKWAKLRALAASVSPTPVKNAAEAVAAIEAEIARRSGDVPLDAAGGRTLRELHADMEAAGVEIDPAASVEEQVTALAMRE